MIIKVYIIYSNYLIWKKFENEIVNYLYFLIFYWIVWLLYIVVIWKYIFLNVYKEYKFMLLIFVDYFIYLYLYRLLFILK